MATVIQIKRSTGVSAPTVSDLKVNCYVQDRSNSGAGAKLFIESVDSDNSTPLIHAIGGKYYTDILAGSSATPNFKVGNGSSAGASLQLMEDSDNGSHFIGLKSPDSVGSSVTYTLPFQTGQTDKFFQRMVRELFLLYLLHQHLLVQQTQTFLLPVVDTFLSMTGQIRLIMLQYQVMQLFANGALTISAGAVDFAMLSAAVVLESEGIGSNDNDTTIPTSQLRTMLIHKSQQKTLTLQVIQEQVQ